MAQGSDVRRATAVARRGDACSDRSQRRGLSQAQGLTAPGQEMVTSSGLAAVELQVQYSEAVL